jgi:hypothetical protein
MDIVSREFPYLFYYPIVSVCLSVCLSVTLREEHKLKVCEDRVLRRISVTRGRKWQEAGEDCIMRSFITCTLQQILLWKSDKRA